MIGQFVILNGVKNLLHLTISRMSWRRRFFAIAQNDKKVAN